MRHRYQAGPVHHASRMVSGGICAGLGNAALAAPTLHASAETEVWAAIVATPPVAAQGFPARGPRYWQSTCGAHVLPRYSLW